MKANLFTILLFSSICLYSQKQLEVKVPAHSVNIELATFLDEVNSKTSIKFFYSEEWIAGIKVTTSYQGRVLNSALTEIVAGRDIELEPIYDYGILLLKNPKKDKRRKSIIDSLNILPKFYSIGDSANTNWLKSYTVSGEIKEDKFEEPIQGISINAIEQQVGTSTDSNGKFSLSLPAGKHILAIQGLNYEAQYLRIGLFDNGELNIKLSEKPLTLDEVVIRDNAKKDNFETALVGRTRISAQELETLPAFLGEVDIVKSIQLLPGVNSVGEGSAGFNVRGGTADQNLILLDDGVIFNPNHLFGFFSSFHPDAVQDVTFYRGAIPSEFGGRISSVLDVKQKDGNLNELKGSGGIGIVSSRLLIEGPIQKAKASFLIAGRSSYSDWVLQNINNDDIRNSSAFFYDITGKISVFPNQKNKWTASVYTSFDRFSFANDTTFYWQNQSLSIKNEKIFNSKKSLVTSLSASNYNYEVRDEESAEGFSWNYSITNFRLKSYLDLFLKSHNLKLGVDINHYVFDRGELDPIGNQSTFQEIKLNQDNATVGALFFNDEYRIDNFVFNAGLRFSLYQLHGEHEQIVYNEDFRRSDLNIIDTVNFETFEAAQRYFGIEPRLSIKYSLNEASFFKVGISRSYQYIHLLSNTTAITPLDSWVPSSAYVEPQIGMQYSLGFFKEVPNLKLRASIEGFYKRIENVPEYIDGADLALKQNIETELVNSLADIRGAELSIQKAGRLSGEFNYTFTSSRRRTSSRFEEAKINNNEFFPANYDQPHNIKISTNYDISKRHVFSLNFNLASGRPITAPNERFVIDGIIVGNFSERNQYRIPTYHRLDASFLIRTNHKKDKNWTGSWTLTLYNIYSRRNAYSVFFQENSENIPQAYRLAVLGSIFPSITYNFKF